MNTSSPGSVYDVLVIGGGINGVGIARDAAGRGYSVSLFEANDLASGTSSASSKLIHGGLRYLEYYEFRLVREALEEREVLLRMAPHIIQPLRFVLPHLPGMRPMWLLRLGLFLYDHLGRRKLLPATRRLNLHTDEAGKSLKPLFHKALEYSDCWVDDSRLVTLNALDAARRGAEINVRSRVTRAERKNGIWEVTAINQSTGEKIHRRARVLVNASGPWVDEVLGSVFDLPQAKHVRLVRGSHIVVKAVFKHDRAYIFQNRDGRIIFAIPYQSRYTLIGTTDQDHGKQVGEVTISPEEQRYLCEAASEYFREPITEPDIVWAYAGVRPLYDDGASEAQEATRDYVVEATKLDNAPIINIFGGKITTSRRLAETTLKHIAAFIGNQGAAWTANSHLPGGDFEAGTSPDFIKDLRLSYPFLSPSLTKRYAQSYGTSAYELLAGVESLTDMGQHFGNELYEVEATYLVDNEWAITAEDILFRRTKLGLEMPPDMTNKLDLFLENIHAPTVSAHHPQRQIA